MVRGCSQAQKLQSYLKNQKLIFFRFLDIPTCIDRFEISLILEQNTNIFSTFGPSTDTKSRKKSKNVKNETFQCPKQFKKSLSKKKIFMRFFQPKTFFFSIFRCSKMISLEHAFWVVEISNQRLKVGMSRNRKNLIFV